MIDGQGKPDASRKQDAKKIRQLMSWWREVRDYDDDNRREMAIDEDFVDGDQYTEAEKQILEARGQLPLVYNEIRLAVAWLSGTEKKTRVDWDVLPREPDDEDGAKTKTEVLKYLSDANRFPFERSAAFDEAVRAGCGWLEVGIRSDGEEPIYVGAESWRNVWRDPMSRKSDLSDARYLLRSKVLDLDIAQAMFPGNDERLRWESDHFEQLTWQNRDIELTDQHRRHVALFPGDTDHERSVVRIIECWYREIERVPVLRGAFSGQIFDERVMAHRRAVMDGRSQVLGDIPKMRVRVALFTLGGYLLADGPSPYIHNRLPFVPLYGFRRARDGAPYGVPRQARDPQIDLNKRRSKALFALSTNKVIADEDAVTDPEQFEREAARPDQVVWKKPNREIVFLNNFQLADAHVNLALQDSEFIRQTSGVTGENLGLDTNAISGKAIIAKQQQGSVTSAGLFDNLRLATQLVGELLLSLVEQFWDTERAVRVLGQKREASFVPVNRMLPDGRTLNDITARQADFKVAERDFSESYRQAMFETTLEIVGRQPPEVAIKLLDLVFDFSDLPNKDEIVKRIRAINGQADPGDPAAQAQAAQAAAEQVEQARQQQAATLDKLVSEAELRRAQSEKALADADKARIDAEATLIGALSPPPTNPARPAERNASSNAWTP